MISPKRSQPTQITTMNDTPPSVLVSPEWVLAHRDDPSVKVVEIAGLGQEQMQAWREGHPPGVPCWDWKSALWDSHARDFPSPTDFARRMGEAGITPQTTVVVYGEPVQFGIYAWWTLRYCGHADVRVLDGARHRWKAEGRPMTADVPPAPAPVRYTPAVRDESMRIGRDEVLAMLGMPGTVILDGRSGEEYRGERVGAPGNPDTGALRYGRIPGARHLMFETLLREDKSFKPRGEILQALKAVGVEPGGKAITYCRMSHRATVLYFAMTELAGLDGVRVYDGSWTEWGNLVSVPVER
jgi:thiosulfate/3-mercaptopyruvate sulfurtransferase